MLIMWKDIFFMCVRFTNATKILLFKRDQRDESLMKAAAQKPYRKQKRFDLNKFCKSLTSNASTKIAAREQNINNASVFARSVGAKRSHPTKWKTSF